MCEIDDDCERGQSCVAMDDDEEISFCFSPCFDDGTCGGDGEQCATLSHDLSLYVCAPPSCEYCYDQDGDGYGSGSSCVAIDCNDEAADINSGMVDDVCDGIDNDCNGLVDDDYPGQCPAPSWRVLNETALADRWVIYEAIFYSDAACSNPLQNQINMVFSSVGDEELEVFLHDGAVNPIETMPWLGGVVDEAAPSASFIGYVFNDPVEVACVELYQTDNPDQRQEAIRIQSGFDNVWNTNVLMAGEDLIDSNGLSFTRFMPSVCGDGIVSSLEECDSEDPYCMNCVVTYVGEGEACLMGGQEIARCDEGLVCFEMEDEGQCLTPRILIEEEECDLNDPTARCDAGLECREGAGGLFVCAPVE
jgi:hypothetical protein